MNTKVQAHQADDPHTLTSSEPQSEASLHLTQVQKKFLHRQKALVKIISNIRQSLKLETICQTATDELNQLLETDRVAIYRFNSDWSGDFTVESVANGWKPLVGVSKPIQDTHLMENQGGRYAANETFAVADIYQVGHADCHIELLEKFQAKAYAIAPIFQDQKLWGLLGAFQNSGPRQWLEDEVQLMAQVGEQIGIALQQANYVSQIQAQSTELENLLQQLKQSQVQLVQNEKMVSLGQLVAGVAHEINNPVNFIHGNLKHVNNYVQDLSALLRLYQTTYPQENDEIQEQAEDIDLDFMLEDLPKTLKSMKNGSERIRQIVLSLRNFSRLDEADAKASDIHEGIDNTLLILGHRFKTNSNCPVVEVVKQYGDIPLVECYPAQLNQVFMNLLVNAIDALEETFETKPGMETPTHSPKIWISTTRCTSDQVEIRIRDNGKGIPQEIQAQIFNHFFTTKVIGKGTGLGLAIARDIICTKHQGMLDLKSTPGQGTEFILTLPTTLAD